MKIIDGYRLARNNLKRTKLRTFLTKLGIIVSISAIVLLVSLGIGLQQLSIHRIATINALTRLTVVSKEDSSAKLDDVQLARIKKIPHVKYVSPEIHYPARATFFDTQSDIILDGIKREYLNFSDISLDRGKTFSSNNSQEILVSKAVLKLFNKENDPDGILGKKMSFEVVVSDGTTDKPIVKEITATIVGTTKDETISNIYIPLDTIRFPEAKNYSSFSLKISDRQYVKDVKTQLKSLGLQTTTVSDLIDQINQAFLYFQIILGAIGGIALFVAGIGIVNTMTISLLERTHEIGIMKALGARDSDIKRVFLYESAILGFKGGITGIIIGWSIGQGINVLINFLLTLNHQNESIILFIMPYKFALTILALATLLSIVAGIYPAKRAAKLSPLQALRYE